MGAAGACASRAVSVHSLACCDCGCAAGVEARGGAICGCGRGMGAGVEAAGAAAVGLSGRFLS